MKQFGLIIQETTAGSNQQFVSSYLDINSPEIKETITDERTLASQLANLSDVYSVQITQNYKVYSLIVTNLTDFLGRSGYYAIRLYGPKEVNLTNFENILASIKEKYNTYTKSNTLNDQNYDTILSSILIVENDKKALLSLKSDANCFYYFDETNSALSTVFNTRGIHLVHKVYAFNKNRAVPEAIALSSGLKAFSQINTSQKEINVINNHSLLKELKINDKNVDFNPHLSEYNILCQANDIVTYNTTEDKNFKILNGTFLSIEKKYVQRKTPIGRPKQPSFIDEYGTYLIIVLMIICLGSGSWYFFLRDNNISTPYRPQNPISNQEANQNNSTTASEITFNFEGPEKDSVFKTNYPKLDQYRFKFDNKKWSYKNKDGKDIYTDFYIETIEEINKSKPLNFNDKQKLQFLNSLKEKSDQEILKKETSEKVAPTIKEPIKKPAQTVNNKKTDEKAKAVAPKSETESNKRSLESKI
ncbi:hypothetical protein SAMN05443667_11920 [Flavobacterium gillisiae]|uniref:Uncharacterized protein n=1 Tax=Flavobacterium gillisiae TaxID=150146 RepID=A0A1H4GC20_9FLAO|nr:hypothetical protein [Flavobacterium gillisiae]SEB06540.1 hypothetical protein SAMN05443667_11920 [Flavobacterium gillisiae]